MNRVRRVTSVRFVTTVGMILIMLLGYRNANGRDGISIELFGGYAENLRSSLTIEQQGEAKLDFWAKYYTRPFDDPWYYAYKIGFKAFNRQWQVQFIHHKLYLSNTTEIVQHFEVTHGFNMLTLNRVFLIHHYDILIGGGIVLPHGQSEIRNKKFLSSGGIFGWGYKIGGPVVIVGISRKYHLNSRVYVSIEGQISGALSEVPVADGRSRVTNVAVHGLFGFGYVFSRK